MAGETKQRSNWGGYSGYSKGFELVAAILGFSLVGYWLGGKFGDVQLGTAIGAVLGIVGGMYNLIRQSLTGSRKTPVHRKKSEK